MIDTWTKEPIIFMLETVACAHFQYFHFHIYVFVFQETVQLKQHLRQVGISFICR